MLKKDKPNGVIIYEGPSRIDRQPIIAIATGFKGNNNSKIGNMIQVWIMRPDIHPCNAKSEGKDFSICGDCKHRIFGSCYVELKRGPIPVFNNLKNGRYVKTNKKYDTLFHDVEIRWGAYGDPAALPLRIIKKYSSISKGWTGYTHQWRKAKNKKYSAYLMASIDSTVGYYKELEHAQSLGWRTFRARVQKDDKIFENEFVCPASKEGGKVTVCQKCNACSGNTTCRKNPVIVVHGQGYKVDHFERGMQAIKNKKKYKKSWNKQKAKYIPQPVSTQPVSTEPISTELVTIAI